MSQISLSSMAIATYVLLLLSVVFLWIRAIRWLWAGSLAVAVVVGYFAGIVTAVALIPIVVLAALCWYYKQLTTEKSSKPILSFLVAILIAVVAALLFLHFLPGYNNSILVRNFVLSTQSAPYTQYLNFDKAFAGLLILGLCYRGALLTTGRGWRDAIRQTWPVTLVTIAVVVALAFVFGFVRFDTKWNEFFPLWALVNLLFTCMSEEALFRGFIQQELSVRFKKYQWGGYVAIAVGAILFGLLHYKGGSTYVVLSVIAGAGYGLAFQRSGRIEMAMLTHFLLNAFHFLVLTYPRAI